MTNVDPKELKEELKHKIKGQDWGSFGDPKKSLEKKCLEYINYLESLVTLKQQ